MQGTNVVLLASAVAIGTSTAAASLHIQQSGTTSLSGILLQGLDNKKWGLNYTGTALAFTEDHQSRFHLINGRNVDIGAGLHIAGVLQVDGSINIYGQNSITTINTTATMTHMMKVTNNGTGPAITAVQLQATQPTFEAYHGTVLALQVASNTFVGISLPEGAPSQALDVGGNINASGFSKAANFITDGSPVASNANIGSLTGGYLAWNRNASDAVSRGHFPEIGNLCLIMQMDLSIRLRQLSAMLAMSSWLVRVVWRVAFRWRQTSQQPTST